MTYTHYNNTPLKDIPEPKKAPFLTLEDKLYYEYWVNRWNTIASTIPCVNDTKDKKQLERFSEKVFEIDYKQTKGE